jgi:hypothetical protein
MMLALQIIYGPQIVFGLVLFVVALIDNFRRRRAR